MPDSDRSPLPAWDLHVHTVYSGHSSPDATVLNMVAGGGGAGLDAMALSEHVPTVVPDVEAWRASKGDRSVIDAVAADLADIDPPAAAGAPKVLLGVEVDADPYSLDGALMLDDLSGIDYVLASTHLFPGGEAFWFEMISVAESAKRRILEAWVMWTAKVAANPAVNAMSHPGALVGARFVIDEFDDEVLAVMTPMLESMAANSTAFELNELLGRKLPARARESYPELVKRARALGVRFSAGSDAHGPEAVGLMPWARSVAREAGLGPEDFIELPSGK